MKALTLTQPYATLVAIGAKKIETRSWRTSYRGPLAIHAAMGWPVYAREFAERFDVRMLAEDIIGRDVLTWNERLEVDRGHVLATTQLTAIDLISPAIGAPEGVSEQERLLGDWRHGRWAWRLDNVEPLLLPVEARGQLGLWAWHPEGGQLPARVVEWQ